jgi:hypothetical protein
MEVTDLISRSSLLVEMLGNDWRGDFHQSIRKRRASDLNRQYLIGISGSGLLSFGNIVE